MYQRQVFGLCRDFYGEFSYRSAQVSCIGSDGGASPQLNVKKLTYNAVTLVDILGTLLHHALLIETANDKLNEPIRILYEELNMSIIPPKTISFEKEIVFKTDDIKSPIQFHLFHTALKQTEPLARTIFFYRVFENSYQGKKGRMKITSILEKALRHDFFPIYIESIVHKKGGTTPNFRKIDYYKKMKRSVSLFVKDADQNRKNIANLIWETGRSGSAHGGNVKNILRHDYGNDYKFAIRISECLELMAAYILQTESRGVFDTYHEALC